MYMNWNVNINCSEVATKYLEVCSLASTSEDVFNGFKKNSSYTPILEHASKEVGDDYLINIKKLCPELLNFEKFFDNDKFGNPNVCDFGFKTCSPTTLAYIHVLANLKNLYGSLDNYNIIEIGGGYGGQSKIINDYYNINSYSIVDLYEVTLLQNKYIEKLNIPNTKTFTSLSYPTTQTFDLVISDYAFTEVTDPLQSEYVKNIVLNSKHGWIASNGPITLLSDIESKFNVKKLPLPPSCKLGKYLTDKSCYITW